MHAFSGADNHDVTISGRFRSGVKLRTWPLESLRHDYALQQELAVSDALTAVQSLAPSRPSGASM